MKAIIRRKDLIVIVIETEADGMIVEPLDGDEDSRFWIPYCDPGLIIDPTDDEIAAVEMADRLRD